MYIHVYMCVIVVFNAKCFGLFTIGKSHQFVLKISMNHAWNKLKEFSADLQCWITGSSNNDRFSTFIITVTEDTTFENWNMMLFIYLYSNSSLDNIPVALITTSFWLKLSITTFMASSLDITNLNKKKKISRQFSLFSYIKMNISYKFHLKDPYFTSHQFDQDRVH